MFNKKKIIAIIPARENSKSIKKKNLLKLGKHPLIAYPINAGKKSKLIDETIVSTDSLEISTVAKKYGGNVPFLRPKKLAKDTSPSSDVIIHAINFFKKKKKFFDYVVLLEPTSPLTNYKDIDSALKKIIKTKSKSLVSIYLAEKINSNNLFKLKKNKLSQLLRNRNNSHIRRQDYKKEYYMDGSIYIAEVNSYLKSKTFLTSKTFGFEIKNYFKQIEIDNKEDIELIKLKLNTFKESRF